MKTTYLKMIFWMALSTMLALTVMPISVFAQDTQGAKEASDEGSAHADRIEGVWDVSVSFVDCDTGQVIRTVRSLNMFIRGGTLFGTPGQIAPAAPPRGPSLGTWQRVSGRHYRAAMIFFRFNPDGSLAGTQKVTRSITLNRDGNGFTATAVFENYDANGIPGSTGCVTETATRVDWE